MVARQLAPSRPRLLHYGFWTVAVPPVTAKNSYLPVISRPREEPIPWGGHVGYCQNIWRDRVIDQVWGFRPTPENTHIFLCGNPAMVEEMVELLVRDGLREHTRKVAGQVHLERYW